MNSKRWLFLGVGIAVFLVGIGLVALKRSAASLPMGIPSPEGGKIAPRAISSSEENIRAATAKTLLAQAERARIEGSLWEAKQLYQQILQQVPTSDVAATVQQRIGEVNLKLLLSPTPTPDSMTYEVQPGDTLSKIAKKFHATVQLLKAANDLTDDRIRPSQRLKVSKAAFSVIVDKSQNTLTLKNGEEVLKIYRCSTGRGGNTPAGTFRIINRIIDPPWYSPDGVIPPGDSRNPLGSRWLGFDEPRYGIHGTIDPSSIGKQVTKGCVRLANADVEELFTLLPEGTPVTIVE